MGQLRLYGLILLFLLSAIVGLYACLGQSLESARAITVSPTNLTTSEDGSTATFTFSLNEAPAGDVVIDVVSTDTTEVLVGDSAIGGFSPYLTLTFTQTDWATPQTVTVQGVDDLNPDGNQNVTVTVNVNTSLTRDTTGYLGINPPDVSVTNIDNDTVGVSVTPTTLVTTEAGVDGTFNVRLNKAPNGEVVIDVTSLDETEGTVSPAQLTFDDTNWSNTRTVTVTPVDDFDIDGNQTYTVTVDIDTGLTTDSTGYASVNPADVSVTNSDNETAGVTIVPATNLTTNENGTTATFTVVLNTEPDGDVVIDIVSTDLTEGTVSATTPLPLIFTPANWNIARTVTVTPVDDFDIDGNQTYTITVDIDLGLTTDTTGYAEVNPNDVTVTNIDSGAPGVTVTPTSGLITTEDGGSDTFDVALNTEPNSDVVIDVASSNTNEGMVSTSQLTFSPGEGRTAQTVTVTGVDDDLTDGNQTYSVTLTMNSNTLDTDYVGLDPADVSVINSDNDAPGVTVSPTSLTTNEAPGAGHTATFTVVLNTKPKNTVAIDVASSDTSEITVSPVQLIFTKKNSSTPQTVTVTGVDDYIIDGNQQVSVTLVTNDKKTKAKEYDAVDIGDVTVTNIDNGAPSATVTPVTPP